MKAPKLSHGWAPEGHSVSFRYGPRMKSAILTKISRISAGDQDTKSTSQALTISQMKTGKKEMRFFQADHHRLSIIWVIWMMKIMMPSSLNRKRLMRTVSGSSTGAGDTTMKMKEKNYTICTTSMEITGLIVSIRGKPLSLRVNLVLVVYL